ncbi:MAG TPA: serine hydroxymethyltransferase [Saprospiraceae bacterium]|nr:serine hydroxymethyltransferase [Saprospiraceae bacterium]
MDQIFHIINKELDRQQRGIELIASENFTSRAVMEAMGSCLTNKYAEGYPGRRYYGGCEHVDEVEELARERIKTLFGCDYANVQPHSGSQANGAIFLSFLNPGDAMLGFDLDQGGHLSHGSWVNYSGKVYKSHFYPLDPETGRINMKVVQEKAHQVRPKLIICGASSYSRDWDYAGFRRIADEVGALLLADIAHPAGLIAKGLLNDPVPHCHLITSTTHKTLRGPRGGIVLAGKNTANPLGLKTPSGKLKRLGTLVDSGVFPGMQGGPLMHVIAAKAVAFAEALEDSFTDYVQQVQRNARTMAEAFQQLGYTIVSGGTDNHLLLIDLGVKGITGLEAEQVLEKADITVNKNMVPNDTQPPKITSGIRIGSSAVTTRGYKEKECKQVVHWIHEVLNNKNDDKKIKQIKAEVNQFQKDYPLYE